MINSDTDMELDDYLYLYNELKSLSIILCDCA